MDHPKHISINCFAAQGHLFFNMGIKKPLQYVELQRFEFCTCGVARAGVFFPDRYGHNGTLAGFVLFGGGV